MKKHRSISIPEKLPSMPKIRSPRDQSNSHRENLIRISNKNPQVVKLHKENLELRSRLKEFNEKLNSLIHSSKKKLKKNKNTDTQPEQNLDILKKNLAYYENEYNRLLNRQKQLSDPSYESQLKQGVDTLKQKLSTYEATVKKSEGKQKLREKALNTVLDTGEMGELQKIFTELNTEVSLYTKRYEKLERLNSQTLQSFKDMSEKTKEFASELETLKSQAGDLEDPKKKQELEKNTEKLNRKFGVVAGEYDSKSKVLTTKLKKLQEVLEKQQKNEDELQVKLDQLSKVHKNYLTELLQLQSRMVYGQRRALNDEFVNDDLMFLTEKVN